MEAAAIKPQIAEPTLLPEYRNHNLESEQSILGAMMQYPEILEEAAEKLKAEDFYNQGNRLIFKAMKGMVDDGQPVDPVLVGDRIQLTENVQLIDYIADVFGNAPLLETSKAHIEIVKRKSTERQMANIGDKIRKLSTEARPMDEKIAELNTLTESVSEGAVELRMRTINAVIQSALNEVQERAEGIKAGILTGFHDYDERSAGLHRGDLIIVAGRPSMGKTAWSMNIGENVALASGRVLVYSLEMSAEQLAMRMLSSTGTIKFSSLRDGKLSEDELNSIDGAADNLGTKQMFIDDTPGLDISQLKAKSRRVHRQLGGLDLIVIDYLQLMQTPGKRSRNEEIGDITRQVKLLARELDVPIILLSQLSRDCEKRQDKRPMASDLRDSGSVEQDADVIIFIYRDEVYNRNSRFRGIAEAIINKMRNGSVGCVFLNFEGKYSRFTNMRMDVSDFMEDPLENEKQSSDSQERPW